MNTTLQEQKQELVEEVPVKSKFELLQEQYDSLNKGKSLQFEGDYEITCLSDIVHRFVNRSFDNDSVTVWSKKDGKKSKRIQCHNNARRSFDDTYRMVKAYIPDITYERIHNILEFLRIDRKILVSFCHVVKKNVMYGFGDSQFYNNKEAFKKYLVEKGMEIEFT